MSKKKVTVKISQTDHLLVSRLAKQLGRSQAAMLHAMVWAATTIYSASPGIFDEEAAAAYETGEV